MIHGKVLRSPHAHARIKSINLDKALGLPGVFAIITGADLPDIASKTEDLGEAAVNPRYVSMNVWLATGCFTTGTHSLLLRQSTGTLPRRLCDLSKLSMKCFPVQ